MKRALLATLVFTGLACSATEIEPEHVESPYFVGEDGSYALELPLGWQRSENSLAHPGGGSHVITFNAGPVLDPADTSGLDPNAPELYQAMRAELEAQPGTHVLECRMDTFDGLPGFRLHFLRAESPESGPARETMICGAVSHEMLYALGYEAAPGAEFGAELATFERLVASFDHLPAAPR